jgi:flagellar biosynthesis protein FlhB
MEGIPNPPYPENKPPIKRPQTLMILCILTFIWSGLGFFSSLFTGVFLEAFQQIAPAFVEQFQIEGFEALFEAPRGFFLLNSLLYLGSVTGAYFMFMLRKMGFHIYAIAQILLLIAPMYFLSLETPQILEILITGLFIILYARQMKYMK